MTNEELILVKGGGITSTMFNSISRLLENLYNFGQTVGSAIRRIAGKSACKLS